jgi:hypothetical protein
VGECWIRCSQFWKHLNSDKDGVLLSATHPKQPVMCDLGAKIEKKSDNWSMICIPWSLLLQVLEVVPLKLKLLSSEVRFWFSHDLCRWSYWLTFPLRQPCGVYLSTVAWIHRESLWWSTRGTTCFQVRLYVPLDASVTSGSEAVRGARGARCAARQGIGKHGKADFHVWCGFLLGFIWYFEGIILFTIPLSIRFRTHTCDFYSLSLFLLM